MNDIPPLQSPDDTPPIRTPRDLHRQWRALMGELGFDERSLWVMCIARDGWVIPRIVQVTGVPVYPTAADLDGLAGVCERPLEYLGEEASVAVLLSRPGRDVLSDSDRAWGRGVAATMHEHGVPTHPMHLANDEAVRVLALDDLIGAA